MNYLEELMEYEEEIINIPIGSIISHGDLFFKHNYTLPLSPRNLVTAIICINCNNVVYWAPSNRSIIHVLGKWTFGDEMGNDYIKVFNKWEDQFNNNHEDFKFDLENTIIENNLIMRVIPNSNRIYGFVSSNFIPTNQIEFRDELINALGNLDAFEVHTSKMHKVVPSYRYSAIKEYFPYDSNSDTLLLRAGITYGLNNGYGAYGVHWIREIKSSLNWLTPMRIETEFKWRNNVRFHDESAKDEMLKFVKFIIEQAEVILKTTDERITYAKNKSINKDSIEKFFKLLRIADASKERIRESFQSKYLNQGNTLFSYSEAIREIGTFDKAVSKNTRRLLIEVGTKILEEDGIEAIINENIDIVLTGSYDWY